MEVDLKSLVEQLSESLEDVSDAIDPLLTQPLSDSASKLPVVDKAKLHVLQVYALESLLFSYLRLNGINCRNHPIMKELNRVKQYVAKIKDAEENVAWKDGKGLHLNKEAAGRFIKAALAPNERMDRLQTERKDQEKLKGKVKGREGGYDDHK